MKNYFLTLAFAPFLLLLASCGGDKNTDVTLTGNWVLNTRYEFPGTPCGGAVCFTIGDKAYMGLGYNGKDYPTDFFVLDLNAGSWKQLPPLPDGLGLTGRERAVSFSAAGKGYVGLGYNRNSSSGMKNGAKDFYSYNPDTKEWKKVANFGGTARYDAIAFSINDKGYVGTGYDEKGYYRSDMYRYDPVADAWTAMENNFPGGKKNRAFALSINNVAYVGGGFNSQSFNSDFWKFDGTTWTSLRPSTDASYWSKYQAAVNRVDANIFTISGKIYITNGMGGGGSLLRSTYEWDPSKDSNEWIEKTSFERAARMLGVSFTLGNRGFICAGQNSSAYLDDCMEWLPDVTANVND